ncbi:fumarate reductase subunit FrdD [Zophobihabitans entericus]|uniref:Fumarate reductase subunit D n=1 Tax=Zophobihabitans entericus TaxID=1635327 RepID=A0A6G9I984_9GAMM|nr:fumarate reductase subunit FrdD [Zophobihabitans entericus]QIQ20781.1 fumarate reductase subunit D [Zophobihabitans entericus]
MEEQAKRSNEPLFWGLFSAGGMWAAIFAPVMIVIVGFVIPFADAGVLTHLLRLVQYPLSKLFLFAMVVLPIWCALHRILHTLHDMKIYPKRGKLLFYGLAVAWTIQAGYVLFFA